MNNNLKNEMTLEIMAISQNESFARSTVAAFAVQLNPTLDQINDIKTAVSEAVTNSIVHGYNSKGGKILISCKIISNILHIVIKDYGVGIKNIDEARQPFFTTKPEQERSGMGFTVMESFMDVLEVDNNSDGGVSVTMSKAIVGDDDDKE